MPRTHKPKIGGYIYSQNIETIRGRIVTVNHLIDEMNQQLEAIIDAGETAMTILNKKLNFPFTQPVREAISIIIIQLGRLSNRLTKVRNAIGEIVTAAEANDRIVTDQVSDVEPTEINIAELQQQLRQLADILDNPEW